MAFASTVFEQADALRWVLRHPLNRGRGGRALARWLLWHLRTGLNPGAPKAIPFVNNTRLLGGRALTTVNIQHYVGLGELDVMGFLLHLLRPGDLMVDVGANVGAISVMAGGLGARVLAAEPVPSSFTWLRRNVALNRLDGQVEALNVAVSDKPGILSMSAADGAANRVQAGGPAEGTVSVRCTTLDSLVEARPVTVVKMDVEGFEVPVARGGGAVWAQPSLKAVVSELKGLGATYGFDEAEVVATLARHGFEPCAYDALARRLTPLSRGFLQAADRPDNVIFVRDRAGLESHLAAAPARPVIWDRTI